eukprot:10254570-Alexandrium_andersonii.AAC.1
MRDLEAGRGVPPHPARVALDGRAAPNVGARNRGLRSRRVRRGRPRHRRRRRARAAGVRLARVLRGGRALPLA